MTIKEALKEVLNNALCHDGVARGLREAVKALDKYDTSTAVLLCIAYAVHSLHFRFLYNKGGGVVMLLMYNV